MIPIKPDDPIFVIAVYISKQQISSESFCCGEPL